jgi:uncharacterized protein (DUF885 family)
MRFTHFPYRWIHQNSVLQEWVGDKFDIREFHDVLLKHGQIPLSVMERVVDDWIEAELRE